MQRFSRILLLLPLALSLRGEGLPAQEPTGRQEAPAALGQTIPQDPVGTANSQKRYVLGPGDEVVVRALGVEEFGKDSKDSVQIDPSGNIILPLAGRIQAGGLTVEQLEAAITERLKQYIVSPEVTVNIVEFRSQPVSVLGSVQKPGVYQVAGQKSLIEMLSMAGGVAENAGNTVKITRRLIYGPIPLPTAAADPSGQFSVAEVKLKSIMDASNPAENIYVQPHDVISVPRGQMVYVIGDVLKPGGYVLNERESLSVLQSLSMAGGLLKTASTDKCKILRATEDGAKRTEIALNLKNILSGKSGDLPLQSEDILFIPGSAGKKAWLKTLDLLTSFGSAAGTGLIIYH